MQNVIPSLFLGKLTSLHLIIDSVLEIFKVASALALLKCAIS